MVVAIVFAVSSDWLCSPAGWLLLVIQTLLFGMVAAPSVASLNESITLAQVAAIFKPRKHVNVVRRWCVNGVRGVLLESHLIGGRRYTTREAIAEFLMKINSVKPGSTGPSDSERAAADARRDAAFERQAQAETKAALSSI